MESSRTAKGRVRRPFARLVGIGVAAAMAIALLPGVASAATPQLVLTESATSGGAAVTTVAAGTPVFVTATYYDANSVATNVTDASNWTITDPNAALPNCSGSYPNLICTPVTVGTWSIIAVDSTHSNIVAAESITVTPGTATRLTIVSVKGATQPTPESLGVADTFTVKAYDANNNIATGFADFVRITSTDPLATLPANAQLTSGVGSFSVTFGSVGSWSVTATDVANSSLTADTLVTVDVVNVGSTYHPLDTPVRLLDTRSGNGHTGKLSAGTPMTFLVSGRGSVPMDAVAVTGNLTSTGSSAGWAVYLGPDPVAAPTSSSLNFTAGQVRANSLTVGLSTTGTLSATYISTTGNTTDLVFDVTGYYGPVGNTDGSGFVPLDHAMRIVDTRNNTGYSGGRLSAGIPATFYIGSNFINNYDSYCSGDVTAVTGNLTVVNPTSNWALYLGPKPEALPTSSTINFVAGQTVSNGVTVGVSQYGNLYATYISMPGNTLDLVFDVTGYYCSNSGETYVPVTPTRLLDTRVGNGYSFPLSANLPQPFQVAGRGNIPAYADAVTGNVTVVNETNGWALYLGAAPEAIPFTSNINFVKGDIIANGMTSGLHYWYPRPAGEVGMLNATYVSTTGNTTDLVFDVSGYFEYTYNNMFNSQR